jgi:DNA-binding transcriptional LysR family regulator
LPPQRWARKRRLTLADLAAASWILPPAGSVPGMLAAEVFHASALAMPPAPVTTLSIHLCCKLLATGRFVATLPTSILHFGGDGTPLKVLPVRLPAQPRPVGVVTLKNRTLSPVAQLFIDCARETAKPLRRVNK